MDSMSLPLVPFFISLSKQGQYHASEIHLKAFLQWDTIPTSLEKEERREQLVLVDP
jgi:hypothetical protein